MFRFLMLISALLITTSAQARNWCHSRADISQDSLIDQIELIGDEVANYDHLQDTMKRSFNKLRRVNRTLDRQFRFQRPSQVSDQDLMDLMQLAVDKLENHSYRRWKKNRVNRILTNTLQKLVEGREDEPVAIAVLETIPAGILDFGFVVAGQSSATSITIYNSGDGDADLDTGVIAGADFDFLGGSYPGTGSSCGNTLSAGLSCTINVEFTAPMIPGTYTGDFSLNYFDGLTSKNVMLSLTGDSQ